MTPIACPQCGSENAWLAAYEGGDPFGAWDLYRCDDCGYEFVVNEWWPDSDDSEVCAADDGIIDDEDAAYAPPADSRSDGARD